jgi:hypothetical protein
MANPLSAGAEETFGMLKIGTVTYTNVTVTTKTKTYVMLMHSTGLANLKVADLPVDVKQQLGYVTEPEKPKFTGTAKVWAREKMAAISGENVGKARKELEQNLSDKSAQFINTVRTLDRRGWMMVYAGLAFGYLLVCFCLLKICQKAGYEPGILIWLPILQVIPLLYAAKMSLVWVLGCLFGLTQIVWCFKIAKARGKTAWTGFFLLFPLTSFFAFLYLTFSNGAAAEQPKSKGRSERVESMSLEVA